MFKHRLAVLAILVFPALALGQRGVRGEKEANWDDITKKQKSALRLSNKDVDNMSPIKMLFDEKKALKLTDVQLKQIKDVDAQLKDRNEELFIRLDSLRTAMKPDASDKDDDRAEMGTARLAVINAVGMIRANYNAALKDALQCLDAAQQKTADSLIAELRVESDKTLRSRLGGGGGGGGAPGGGGRRPPQGG